MKCKMISLDTSSTITGYAYWEKGVLKESGILYHKDEKDAVIRVEDMCISINQLLKKHKPDILVIEKPPYCNSPEALIILAEIVGSAKGWAITSGAEYIEYPVNKWRKLVARKDETIPIKRVECKCWDIKKAETYLLDNGITKGLEDDNEADAILIGLARINQINEIVNNAS